MNESLIRASLDQSLLALEDLESGDAASAAVRAALAAAWATLGAGDEGDSTGRRPTPPRERFIMDRWFAEMRTLALAMDAEAEWAAVREAAVEATEDPNEAVPSRVLQLQLPARSREPRRRPR